MGRLSLASILVLIRLGELSLRNANDVTSLGLRHDALTIIREKLTNEDDMIA